MYETLHTGMGMREVDVSSYKLIYPCFLRSKLCPLVSGLVVFQIILSCVFDLSLA